MTLQHPHADLSAYIDGALDRAAQAAVDGHLVACAVCRAHVAQLRATSAFVRALPDPIPSRRLVPRLAPPVWLAPLRTVMSMASGAAVFLFIASALVSNMTLLASGGATGTTAREASGDSAANAQAAKAIQPAQPANTTAGVPAPAFSPSAAFAASGPTASTTPDGEKRSVASPGDTARVDQATAAPTGALTDARSGASTGAPQVAVAPQDTGRDALSAPRPSPLLNPWLWLTLAIVCGAIALALQRRLRTSG